MKLHLAPMTLTAENISPLSWALVVAVSCGALGAAFGFLAPIFFSADGLPSLFEFLIGVGAVSIFALPFVLAGGAIFGVPIVGILSRVFPLTFGRLLLIAAISGAAIGLLLLSVFFNFFRWENALPGATAGLAAASGWWKIAPKNMEEHDA